MEFSDWNKKPPGLVRATNTTSSHRVSKAPCTHPNEFDAGGIRSITLSFKIFSKVYL